MTSTFYSDQDNKTNKHLTKKTKNKTKTKKSVALPVPFQDHH